MRHALLLLRRIGLPVTLIVAGLILRSVWVERVVLRWLPSMPAVPSPAGTATSPALKDVCRAKRRWWDCSKCFRLVRVHPSIAQGDHLSLLIVVVSLVLFFPGGRSTPFPLSVLVL